MNSVKDIIRDIAKNVQGVVGVILIDTDGIPVELSGDFDMPPEDLGALLSACYHSYSQVGEDLGQKEMESIIAEYNDLKLCQHGMPRGALIIVAEKDAYLGVIRMEAKRAIKVLTRIMEDTADQRAKLMEEHKFRRPDEALIKDSMDVDEILADI